jgi:hypothetical protein
LGPLSREELVDLDTVSGDELGEVDTILGVVLSWAGHTFKGGVGRGGHRFRR